MTLIQSWPRLCNKLGDFRKSRDTQERQKSTNCYISEKSIPAPIRPEAATMQDPGLSLWPQPGSMPRGRRQDVTRTAPARKQCEDMCLVNSGSCDLFPVFQ